MHTMWLKYYSPRKDSAVKVSTEGSGFDTVVAVYESLGGNLTLLACDDDGGYDSQTSLLFFPAEAQRNYYIAVDGVDGARGTVRLQVGEIIRRAVYDAAKGIFRFEIPGNNWFYNHLLSTTNLTAVTPTWNLEFTVAPSADDWILPYTNFTAASDLRRFYTVKLTNNASLTSPATGAAAK